MHFDNNSINTLLGEADSGMLGLASMWQILANMRNSFDPNFAADKWHEFMKTCNALRPPIGSFDYHVSAGSYLAGLIYSTLAHGNIQQKQTNVDPAKMTVERLIRTANAIRTVYEIIRDSRCKLAKNSTAQISVQGVECFNDANEDFIPDIERNFWGLNSSRGLKAWNLEVCRETFDAENTIAFSASEKGGANDGVTGYIIAAMGEGENGETTLTSIGVRKDASIAVVDRLINAVLYGLAPLDLSCCIRERHRLQAKH